jgi:hypothetical protein
LLGDGRGNLAHSCSLNASSTFAGGLPSSAKPGLGYNQLHALQPQAAKLKSECSRDELPLDPDVATILLEWKWLCPATDGDWVFPSPRTAKPYDSGSLRKKVLKAATLRAKIPGTDRLAYVSPQLSRLARRNGCSTRRAAETDASCQHLNHDERLRRGVHGIEAQSQHIRRAAGPSRPYEITKSRPMDGLSSFVQSLLDHFRP